MFLWSLAVKIFLAKPPSLKAKAKSQKIFFSQSRQASKSQSES